MLFEGVPGLVIRPDFFDDSVPDETGAGEEGGRKAGVVAFEG